jgi:antitoxin MazE
MRVESKVQKWGNGLAIRIAGVMRDIPHFHEGTLIEVEVTEQGLMIKKLPSPTPVRFTEEQLLADLTPHQAFSDLLAKPLDREF